MNNTKLLPDAFAKHTSSNNYKLLQLANLIFTDLQADIESIARSRDISYATGKTLDRYGEMVGVSRGAATDEQYRVKILNKIGASVSNGDCNSVISAISQMLDVARNTITLTENTDASVMLEGLTLEMLEKSGYTPKEMNAMIARLFPAGIELIPPVYAGTLEIITVPIVVGDSGEYRTLYRAWLAGQKALSEQGKQVGLAGTADLPESFLTMADGSPDYSVTGSYTGGTLGQSSK